MNKISTWSKRHKVLSAIFILSVLMSIYIYKCYTDPYYFKSELYGIASERCRAISNLIPDGSAREHVEKILIDSDGARIEAIKPNSKSPAVGSILYNLDPWSLYANDAAYIYVWYDENDKVIGMGGTHCGRDRYPEDKKQYLNRLLQQGESK